VQKFVVLTQIEQAEGGAAVEELHGRMVQAMSEAAPDLRWYSSYRVDGAYDYVDVVELQQSDDPSAPAAAVERLGFARSEWLPAVASEWLRAPGGPGGAPGGGPGQAPGASP
jgi:hypothetical protein